MCKNTEYKNVCEIGRLKVDVARLEQSCKNKDEYIDNLLVSKTTLEDAVISSSDLIESVQEANLAYASEFDANLLKIDVLTKEIASIDESWQKRLDLAQDEIDSYSKKNVKLIKRNVTLSRQVDELKSKLAESPKPTYITPDDDIARDRPAAEFRDYLTRPWEKHILLGVYECQDIGKTQYVSGDGRLWEQCRVAVEG